MATAIELQNCALVSFSFSLATRAAMSKTTAAIEYR